MYLLLQLRYSSLRQRMVDSRILLFIGSIVFLLTKILHDYTINGSCALFFLYLCFYVPKIVLFIENLKQISHIITGKYLYEKYNSSYQNLLLILDGNVDYISKRCIIDKNVLKNQIHELFVRSIEYIMTVNKHKRKAKGQSQWLIQRNLRYWARKTEDKEKQNTKTQHIKLKRLATRIHKNTQG